MNKEIINCIHNDEMGKPNAENALCLIDPDDKCCKDIELKFCYYKQLQHLKQESKKLEASNRNLKLALETYQLPEVVRVLTDWHTGELDLQANKLKKREEECKKYQQALEEIRDKLKLCLDNGYLIGNADDVVSEVLTKIKELLNV